MRKYVVEDKIGDGGFGTVHVVHDKDDPSYKFALKAEIRTQPDKQKLGMEVSFHGGKNQYFFRSTSTARWPIAHQKCESTSRSLSTLAKRMIWFTWSYRCLENHSDRYLKKSVIR